MASPAPARAANRTPARSDRARVLLDSLMILSTAAGTLWGLALTDRSDVPPAVGLRYLAVVVAMVVGWLLLRPPDRRSARVDRVIAVLFAALGAAGIFVGDGPGTWPLFLMGLLVVVPRFGARAGMIMIGFVLVGQAVALTVGGRGAAEVGLQALGTTYVFGFGLALAWLVAEYDRQRRQNAALVEEVRRGVRVEAELALAEERTRAARELHDGLGHRLTLIGMLLDYAERMRDREPDRARSQLARARTETADALSSMRLWVRALSPVRTADGSLGAALNAIAESFRGTGLEVEIDAADAELDVDRPTLVFGQRFVQEAMTNALRHATVSRILVRQQIRADEMIIEVSDDGGPSPLAHPTEGFGLRSLRERAGELGGRIEIEPEPTGWTIRAALPVVAGAPAERS